jgi:hypothetical protein
MLEERQEVFHGRASEANKGREGPEAGAGGVDAPHDAVHGFNRKYDADDTTANP